MNQQRQITEQRITFLMMALQLPGDVQESWSKVLSVLGEEELNKIKQSLEREYLAAVTRPLDVELAADVQKLAPYG
ncbi:hypothetical protein HY546_00365 [archaeon]|nr:hypothetical protein [archaeon]